MSTETAGCAHGDTDDGERTRALDGVLRGTTTAIAADRSLRGQIRRDRMRRLVLRMPHALIERIDRLADALNQRPRAKVARASRAGVLRTLIAGMLATSNVQPIAGTAWDLDRRHIVGKTMRRIVLRMPSSMVETVDGLHAELRAQQPAESWTRALVLRGLLALGLTSAQAALLSEAAPPAGGAADRVEA